MPTEVTPSPHQLAVNAAFYHGWSSMPSSGPAQASDLLPIRHIPGSVMPSGLRNPWAHYHGETYAPSAHVAAVQGEHRFAGSDSYVGGGGSMIEGGAMSFAGGGGGSVIAPSSVSLGGYREDDGWNGSMGRVHAGHAPDMSSIAGAISYVTPVGGAGGWLNQPASWGNHARMTPTVVAALAGSEVVHPVYGQSPSYSPIGGHHRSSSVPSSSRRNSVVEDCSQCHSYVKSGHTRRTSTPVPIHAGSPMRRMKELPLDQRLKRSGSRRRIRRYSGTNYPE